MADGHDYAMSVVRAADPDRYLSVLYTSPEKRESLFVLYAFNVEIAGIRDRISEPLPGAVRLQFWRDTLTAGTAEGGPLAAGLLAAIEAHHLPVQSFIDYLDAREFDLYDDPMPSRNDLEGYCGETASALIQLASLILDPDAAASSATLAGHAGCAQAMTGLLRLLPIHRARGQCYVPADILSAVGTTREELIDGAGEGPRRAVAAMAALAREHLERFVADAPALPASLRPAYLPVTLTRAYLERLTGPKVDPLREIADVPSVKRHWLMLKRASRGW